MIKNRVWMAAGVASLAIAVVASDAQAQRGGRRGGAASLPQVTCAAGAPEATTFAGQAQEALNRTLVVRDAARSRPFFEQAAGLARQGIAAGESNPYHHFLLGQAQLGLGNYASADSALRRTLELCPEFAGEVRQARRQAFVPLFQAGAQAFEANDTATALERWETAVTVYDEIPDPYFNAGVLLSGRGDLPAAAAKYRQALRAAQANTDTALARDIAEMRNRTLLALSNVGIRLFQDSAYAPAIEILGEVSTANPNDRLAKYVRALAFYQTQRWNDLIPAARAVLEMDPLNYNAYLLLYNAQRALADAAKNANNTATERQIRAEMVSVLERADALPVQIENIQFNENKLVGDVASGKAAAGTNVVIEFTLYGQNGELGTQRVTVAAPAENARTRFEVAIPMEGTEAAMLMGYKYRLVP